MRHSATILSLIALIAISAPQAQAHCGACGHSSHAKASNDIVETAVAAGDFQTLAAALTEAGLVEALKGKGPFTVFAPTVT